MSRFFRWWPAGSSHAAVAVRDEQDRGADRPPRKVD
jgi:hypothetical protein